MAKVVTMGEIMLRLSTPGNEKFLQADEFDVCYGGGAVSYTHLDVYKRQRQGYPFHNKYLWVM